MVEASSVARPVRRNNGLPGSARASGSPLERLFLIRSPRAYLRWRRQSSLFAFQLFQPSNLVASLWRPRLLEYVSAVVRRVAHVLVLLAFHNPCLDILYAPRGHHHQQRQTQLPQHARCFKVSIISTVEENILDNQSCRGGSALHIWRSKANVLFRTMPRQSRAYAHFRRCRPAGC